MFRNILVSVDGSKPAKRATVIATALALRYKCRVQRAGQSHSREEGWKLFHVDELQDITISEDGFDAPRLGYMRNEPSMTKLYAEL